MTAASRHLQKQFESFKPEYVELLQKHLKENSLQSFAKVVNVQSTVGYRWIRKHKEFRAVAMCAAKVKSRIYIF